MQEDPNLAPLLPDEDYKDHDRVLPIANITRIMKRALPENAKLSKDAREWYHNAYMSFMKISVQDCLSEFILFLTSEASERCVEEGRKTMSGDDILTAMQTLGFENYYDAMKIYLHKYKESMNPERNQEINSAMNSFYQAGGHGMNAIQPSQLMNSSQLGMMNVLEQDSQEMFNGGLGQYHYTN